MRKIKLHIRINLIYNNSLHCDKLPDMKCKSTTPTVYEYHIGSVYEVESFLLIL